MPASAGVVVEAPTGGVVAAAVVVGVTGVVAGAVVGGVPGVVGGTVAGVVGGTVVGGVVAPPTVIEYVVDAVTPDRTHTV